MNKHLFLNVLLCLLITGCTSNKQNTAADAKVNISIQQQKSSMMQCLRDLNLLKVLDQKSYSEKKMQFDALMNSTARYASLRKGMSGEAQITVDALYQYKTEKMCAEFSSAALNKMLNTGESLP